MAKKSSKLRKFVIFGIIVAVVGGLSVAALLKKREPVIRVETEKVTRRNLTETVMANGKIQPVTQVKISAEVSGEITELPIKEGQPVRKGDLLVKIKPDVYQAQRRSAEAGYLSALSSKALSEANLRKAELEFKRNEELANAQLISPSAFLEFKTALDIAKAQAESSQHQISVAKASLDRAEEELNKTTIISPIDGTVSKLNLEVGERVAGNTMMAGTEIMTVADLNAMEAQVDIGESDIVLICVDQPAELEVDAFRDRKFKGTVTEIANSSKGLGAAASQSQDAVKFEVRIRIDDQENFRPGMSVNAEVQTRSRTNVLTVPVQSVTTRPPKPPTNHVAGATNQLAGTTNSPAQETNTVAGADTNAAPATNTAVAKAADAPETKGKKPGETPKPIEVVFAVEGDHVKMIPVKRGISDATHVEIIEGLTEGQEIVSGGFKAISRELEDGKKIQKGKVVEPKEKK